jgi:hypothetical protein
MNRILTTTALVATVSMSPAVATTVIADFDAPPFYVWENAPPDTQVIESGPLSIDGNYLRVNAPGSGTHGFAEDIAYYFDSGVQSMGFQFAFDMMVVEDFGAVNEPEFGTLTLGFKGSYSLDFVDGPVELGEWITYSALLDSDLWSPSSNSFPYTPSIGEVLSGGFYVGLNLGLQFGPDASNGYAEVLIDNVRIEPVPVPLGLPLAVIGIGAIAVVGRKSRRVSNA